MSISSSSLQQALQEHLSKGSPMRKMERFAPERFRMGVGSELSVTELVGLIKEYFNSCECKIIGQSESDSQLMFMAEAQFFVVTITLFRSTLLITVTNDE